MKRAWKLIFRLSDDLSFPLSDLLAPRHDVISLCDVTSKLTQAIETKRPQCITAAVRELHGRLYTEKFINEIFRGTYLKNRLERFGKYLNGTAKEGC